MIDLFQAFLLGIVEGITEFLPISSTAHLILVADFLDLSQTEFLKSFEIVIQSGAILAVVFLYWRSLLKIEVVKRLLVAFIPTGILGAIFYKLIKTHLIGNVNVVLWTLFLGGIFLIIFEKWHEEKEDASDEIESISYWNCLYIGLFQSLAMVPGVSRSASTIIGGLILGLKRKTIVEFSFLLAVPTMAAATGFDLLQNAGSFSMSEAHILAVGFLTSFAMAILGIKFLLVFVRKKTFMAFGIYRIALSAAFFLR